MNQSLNKNTYSGNGNFMGNENKKNFKPIPNVYSSEKKIGASKNSYFSELLKVKIMNLNSKQKS
jgi:hypothetical protein